MHRTFRISGRWRLVYILLLAFCVSTAGRAVAAEIEIAVAGPMSGDFSAQGLEMRLGSQAAAREINAQGGVAGDQIRIVEFDDKGNPATAIQIAKKIARQDIRFVVGHYNSGASIPTSQIYAKNGVLMISPASTNPALTEGKLWNVLRTAGRDDFQGSFAATFLANKYSGKPVAIIHDRTEYGKGIARSASAVLSADGGSSIIPLEIRYGQRNFSKIVRALKGSKVAAVFFAGLADEYGALLKDVQKEGLETQFVASDGTLVGNLPALAGPALEETLVVFSRNDAANIAAKDAVAALRAEGLDRFEYAIKAYAAVQIIAAGIDRAKSQDARAVAKAIKSNQPFQTALGKISFDTKGDRSPHDTMLYVWRRGGIVPAP